MATILIQCPDCSTSISASVGESFIDDKLRWYQSYSCPSCGSAVEMDDTGFPPDNVRSAIIDDSGTWQVVISDQGQKSKAVQVVRNAMGFSLADAKQLIAAFPEVYSGASAECAWLKSVLGQSSIAASVVAVDAGGNQMGQRKSNGSKLFNE